MEGSCTKLNPCLKNEFERKRNDVWQQQTRNQEVCWCHMHNTWQKAVPPCSPALQSIIAKCWHCRLYKRACEHQRKCLCLWKTLNWSARLAALTWICQHKILLLCQLNWCFNFLKVQNQKKCYKCIWLRLGFLISRKFVWKLMSLFVLSVASDNPLP